MNICDENTGRHDIALLPKVFCSHRRQQCFPDAIGGGSVLSFVGPKCILYFEEGFVLGLRNDEVNVCCHANAYGQKHQEAVLLQANLYEKNRKN